MIANAKGPELLSGLRKAAILMIVLGDKASAELIKQLEEDEVQTISREITRVTSIPSEQAEAVLDEFYQMTMAREYVVKGGMDYARKVLVEAYGAEPAKRLLDRLTKTLGKDVANFDMLQRADPQQLAKFVHSEHPQTVALILSHLNPSQAAGLLIS